MKDWTGTVTITGNQCVIVNDRACHLGLTLHGILVQESTDGLLIETKDYSVEILAKGYIAVYDVDGNTVTLDAGESPIRIRLGIQPPQEGPVREYTLELSATPKDGKEPANFM